MGKEEGRHTSSPCLGQGSLQGSLGNVVFSLEAMLPSLASGSRTGGKAGLSGGRNVANEHWEPQFPHLSSEGKSSEDFLEEKVPGAQCTPVSTGNHLAVLSAPSAPRPGAGGME